MKKRFLTKDEWRKKHPKCIFCQHLKHVDPWYVVNAPDYYECIVKDRIILFTRLPRLLCPCYKSSIEEKENERSN